MFCTDVNALVDAGVRILRMEEPCPIEKLLRKHPEYYGFYHKPDFLLVKALR